MTPATVVVSGLSRLWKGGRVLIVAELSANHRQSYDEAVAIVKAASDAGADAIKLQTYTPDTITLDSQAECFRVRGGTVWDGRNLYDLYKEAYTPWEWHRPLQKLATSLGMDFFSSAFDATSIDFLETLNVAVHKIASFELVDIPLIRKAASTGKPLILSTGMATLGEIEEAVEAARQGGAPEIALLKCTSAYPAMRSEMNLRTIPVLAQIFGVPVGLSDHSAGVEAPVTAVVLGAALIEKHLTLSRSAGGPDSSFSLEPAEFRDMVTAIRKAEDSLGAVHFGATEREQSSRGLRKSLFVSSDILQGEQFTDANIRSVRPANGLHPRYFDQILNRTASCALSAGTPLRWTHVADANSSDTAHGKINNGEKR